MDMDTLIAQANQAWRDGNMELHSTCMWLLRTLGCMTPGARQCCGDVQFDYEREAQSQGVPIGKLLR